MSPTPRESPRIGASEAPDRLIDIRQLEQLVGLKRSAIADRVHDGRLPPPVRLSSRCNRWRLSEVQAWIASQEGAQ